MQIRRSVYGKVVRPWNTGVLVPPTSYYNGYVKSKYKRQRYQLTMFLTIAAKLLKYSGNTQFKKKYIERNSHQLKERERDKSADETCKHIANKIII